LVIIKQLYYDARPTKYQQSYWLEAFTAAHRRITINLNAIMEEPGKIREWLTTGILPKSGYSKEVSNYQPITCLTNMYEVQYPKKQPEKAPRNCKSRPYCQQSKKCVILDVKDARIILYIKINI
jgi:hypothetical protein